jgi:hypothetical protein
MDDKVKAHRAILAQAQKLLEVSDEPAPLPLPIEHFDAKAPAYPPVLIDGLLRQQELFLMGGEAKHYKSWARIDMLYCIGNGFDWLGFKCHQGCVFHLDFECFKADVWHRFNQVHQSYCAAGFKGSLDNIHWSALREVALDHPFGANDLAGLPEYLGVGTYTVFSLDPIYQLLGGKGESDPAAVFELLRRLLALGSSLKSAVAVVQHFAKGDQSLKKAQDRLSGSSVWARFPDALMTFTGLKEKDCFGCDITVRSFKPVESFAVRWEFPRFRVDQSLDPEDVKTLGRPKETSLDQFCSLLTAGESVPHSDFERRAIKVLGISSATFSRRLREAKDKRLIYLSKVSDPEGYALSPAYFSSNGH